jgi:tetratricopeptide (TPR) repeat protein
MKTSERHHLKENEFANAVGRAQLWLGDHSKTLIAVIVAVVLVGAGFLAFLAWQTGIRDTSAALLAEAMVVHEGRVAPPAPPAGTTNDPTNPGGQLPGTYPTLQAKLETALPKFLAAADAYPSTPAGQTARLHAAETLSGLGRHDEALAQYDQVIASGDTLLARAARLGKVGAELAAGRFDPAIATLKELSEQQDSTLPKDALLIELARVYRLAGKTDDARKTLTQVVEQHADSPYASEAKAEIEKLKG